jgi:hypothetical protein
MIMHRCFEFLIRFTNFNRRDLSRCLARLPVTPDACSATPHFELRLEADGIYFRDLARSDFSARMFRIVLELALEHSEVQIEGFGSGGFEDPARFYGRELAGLEKLLTTYRATIPARARPQSSL